jgi:hypothetical protein
VRSCCVLSFVMPNMRNGGSLTEASFNNAAAAPSRVSGLLSIVVAPSFPLSHRIRDLLPAVPLTTLRSPSGNHLVRRW